MSDTEEIQWSLVFKMYRARVNRGRYSYIIHIEREQSDGAFTIMCIHCDRDAKIKAFSVGAGAYAGLRFGKRKAALDWAISIADAELKKLLRKAA